MKEDLNQTIILSRSEGEAFLDFDNSIDLDYIITLLNREME